MPCYRPVSAYRKADGSVVFAERGDIRASVALACGRCVGCRLESARNWGVRVMHEASGYDRNCVVTLTYADAFLPPGGSLRYRDVVLFLKNLRESRVWRDEFGNRWFKPIRFFLCGEYGEKLSRPHYHVCLFNEDFSADRYVWKPGQSGSKQWRSPELEQLWKFGNSTVGELDRRSAEYVARYVVKKVTGDRAADHYRTVDLETGEVIWREPEFVQMSRRPGIGARWFDKYWRDVFPHDRVVVKGVQAKPPRYYLQRMKRIDADVVDVIRQDREVAARARFSDNTDERLKTKETVAEARLRFFKRGLK